MANELIVNASDRGVTEFAIEVSNDVKNSSLITVTDPAGIYRFAPASHVIHNVRTNGIPKRWALVRVRTLGIPPTPDELGEIYYAIDTGAGPFDYPAIPARFVIRPVYGPGRNPGPQRLVKSMFRPQELYLPLTGLWTVNSAKVIRSTRGKWAVLNVTQVPGMLRLVVCCTDPRGSINPAFAEDVGRVDDFDDPSNIGALVERFRQYLLEKFDPEVFQVTLTPDPDPNNPPPPVPVDYGEPPDDGDGMP